MTAEKTDKHPFSHEKARPETTIKTIAELKKAVAKIEYGSVETCRDEVLEKINELEAFLKQEIADIRKEITNAPVEDKGSTYLLLDALMVSELAKILGDDKSGT